MKRCLFFIFLCVSLLFCSGGSLFAQQPYQWCKGMWLYYEIKPDTIQKQSIETELEITALDSNRFTGFQKVYCSSDTLSQLIQACSGQFENRSIHFEVGKEHHRKEPEGLPVWNHYANYKTDTTYFSIRDHKLILHILTKEKEKNRVTEFAYYRDLNDWDFSMRMVLMKRYGTPQIWDDSVPVVTPHDDTNTSSLTSITSADNTSLPPEIITRKNTLVKTLQVSSPTAQIILLDDAEIDGDIISLYHNNELVLDHKTLGKEMVKYILTMDKAHPHHEFTLVANNLGSIPPNTALVRIRAGEVKYEFIVHSNLNENVKWAIDYTGP